MFDIGAPEFIVLLLLAVIMFGPERLPDLARKAARVLHFLRGIANNAQAQLREELGPEYADFNFTDLTPRQFIQKHLLDDLQEEIDEIKGDITGIRDDLRGEADDLREIGSSAAADFNSALGHDNPTEDPATWYLVNAPYDLEAT